MSRHPIDVLVCGGGIAGLHVSRFLAGAGLNVVLIDQKHRLSERVHTSGIFVKQTVRDFRLPPRFFGPGIRRVVLHSPADREVEFESGEDEFRIGHMTELYEHWRDEAARAGVDIHLATRLEEVNLEASGVTARLRVEGQEEVVTPRFVIGADGAKSRVARALGLSVNRRFIIGAEEVMASGGGTPRLECYLDPNLAPGYIAWVADDGEQAHVGVGGEGPGYDPRSALDRFKNRIGLNATILERRGGLIPVGGVLPDIANRYGLLVGDAAGMVSPLTAGGFDPSIRFSHMAAQMAASYLQSGDTKLLRSYRGATFNPAARLTLRRLFSLMRQPALFELGFVAMRCSILHSAAREVFFGPGSFARIAACQPVIAAGIGGDSI
jgi:flavin-dependent dehydrogenase